MNLLTSMYYVDNQLIGMIVLMSAFIGFFFGAVFMTYGGDKKIKEHSDSKLIDLDEFERIDITKYQWKETNANN